MIRGLSAVAALMLVGATPATAQDDDAATGPVVVVEDGVALVDEAALRPSGTGYAVQVRPEDGRGELPIVDPGDDRPAAGALRRLAARGLAAGLDGVLYDNRDRNHSTLAADAFPQLSRVRYGAGLQERGLDYALGGPVRFSLPVIGNSSTALTRGPFRRSLGRAAITDSAAALRAYRLYADDHLYVYPEHRDHDPERGDLFPANVPFHVISQGSSGSDRPFLDAAALIISALPPKTRDRLEAENLLAPTVQMILRRGMRGVVGEAGYLSGAAHPTVFDRAALRPGAMVAIAAAMPADAIPPLVELRIEQDLQATPGRDYLAANLDEELFTTPAAIGRLWRSFAYRRSMTLSAAGTRDPNGRDLAFRWVLLRGDPERVRISPAGPDGATAEVTIEWHEPRQVRPDSRMLTRRIDIGVFADNGVALSAPSILSVAFPTQQQRRYALLPGGPRLLSIEYGRRDDPWADPALWPTAPFADTFSYDESGERIGLIRRRDGGALERWRLTEAGWARGPDEAGGIEGETPLAPHLAVRGEDGRLRLAAPEGAADRGRPATNVGPARSGDQ